MISSRPYKRVQALERGLQLLQTLNRLGRASPNELSLACELDRTTSYRLLATMEMLGFIAKSDSDDKYVLLPKVRQLSDGFTEHDEISLAVIRVLRELLDKVLWPSDYATFTEGSMVIQETTHRFSPHSIHRAMVGRKRPLLRSALGRAYLAALTPEARSQAMSLACATGHLAGTPEIYAQEVEKLVLDYEERGYAWSVGGTDARISAIALPVQRDNLVFGSVNLIVFKTAMPVENVAERYLADLRHAVEVISLRL